MKYFIVLVLDYVLFNQACIHTWHAYTHGMHGMVAQSNGKLATSMHLVWVKARQCAGEGEEAFQDGSDQLRNTEQVVAWGEGRDKDHILTLEGHRHAHQRRYGTTLEGQKEGRGKKEKEKAGEIGCMIGGRAFLTTDRGSVLPVHMRMLYLRELPWHAEPFASDPHTPSHLVTPSSRARQGSPCSPLCSETGRQRQ